MKLTTFYCSLLFLFFQNSLFSQQPNYQWMKKMEVLRAERFTFYSNNHLLVDSRGNSYRLQVFRDETSLEDTTLTTDGHDAFLLTKHNSEGKLEWARKIVGYNGGDEAHWGWTNSICFDLQENLIISGLFWSNELDFGSGTRLAAACSPGLCHNLFTATYSPQGNLIDKIAFAMPENHQVLYPILHVDSRGKKIFTFVTDAPMLRIGDKLIRMQYVVKVVTLQLSSKNELEHFTTFEMDGGSILLPFNSSTQKDGSVLVFGNIYGIDAKELTLSAREGTSHSIKKPIGDYELFLLLKQSSNGKLLWALDIVAATDCQMLADSSGHTYVLGAFNDTLQIGEKILFENKDDLADGFILKIGADGKVLWQKQLENAPIPVYDGNLFSASPGSFGPGGSLLVPLFVINEDAETPREIEGKEIQASFENYASVIAHFSSAGQLETLVPIETPKGIMLASNCKFDPDGRIYAVFHPLERDSLLSSPYRYAMERERTTDSLIQEHTEFFACFSLNKQLPRINFPVLPTKYDRDLRIRISPNPTPDLVEVRWVPQEEPAQLTLRDATGRQLETIKIAPLAFEARLDLSNYVAGVYFIEWMGKSTLQSSKIIKY
ncbi:T9SS type A sorting domain-containing protein [Haliscomenobacter sp.]|uniref:T9SS type A sorting domain-containing protein n=1 Tax=Haliscomenobacter sp. TaxID=2717303 RepID=UPI003BADB4A6